MKAAVILLSILAILVLSALFFTRYHSAFEADQACHSIKLVDYGTSDKFDCDHDTETRQWLLYEKYELGAASKVIKRFRY